MDDQIEPVLVGVRADTQAFGRDVATLRTMLADGLASGADRAGQTIERALGQAVRSGKLDFADLRDVALKALGEIAEGALRGVLDRADVGGGIASLATGLLGGLLGLPGRATGGPVSPGAAYLVGERGPELFVPTSAGRVAPAASPVSAREVRVAIAINAPAGGEPLALARSSRQVARAVSRALGEAEG